MSRHRLKAFDPYNTDAKARRHWERLQRGEHKHAYDQPPAHKDDDPQHLSTSMRRFRAQVEAAKTAAAGQALKRQPAAADIELSRKKQRKRKSADSGNAESAESRQQAAVSSNKKRKAETKAEKTAEERAEEEAATRAAWEAKVSKMRQQPATRAASSAVASRDLLSAALPSPPSPLPPPREFPTAEHIPFGTQVERPPQHLAELQQRLSKKRGNAAALSSGHSRLSVEQYAVERQQAMAAYEQMRQRRRAAERGSTAMVRH